MCCTAEHSAHFCQVWSCVRYATLQNSRFVSLCKMVSEVLYFTNPFTSSHKHLQHVRMLSNQPSNLFVVKNWIEHNRGPLRLYWLFGELWNQYYSVWLVHKFGACTVWQIPRITEVDSFPETTADDFLTWQDRRSTQEVKHHLRYCYILCALSTCEAWELVWLQHQANWKQSDTWSHQPVASTIHWQPLGKNTESHRVLMRLTCIYLGLGFIFMGSPCKRELD